MIIGVVNGLYRSGTSWAYKMIAQANPDVISLYEPFYPFLHEHLTRTLYFKTDFKLPFWKPLILLDYARIKYNLPLPSLFDQYGLDIEDNYIAISYGNLAYKNVVLPLVGEELNNFSKRKNGKNPIYLKDIEKIIKTLHDSDKKFFLQVNRCHFVLDLFVELGIPTYHIMRPVEEIVSSCAIKTSKKRRERKNWFKDVSSTNLEQKLVEYFEKYQPFFKYEVRTLESEEFVEKYPEWKVVIEKSRNKPFLDKVLLFHHIANHIAQNTAGVNIVHYPNFQSMFEAFNVKNYTIRHAKMPYASEIKQICDRRLKQILEN